MTKIRLTFSLFAACAVCLFCSSLAEAQTCRTWVSGVGDDVNPCSRTAPCKTFAGAISKTAEGGEIDVLDPGGYGSVTITKSITIDGGTGSGWASILASGTTGVIVNVTTNPATSVVILRNISINGTRNGSTCADGTNGVSYLAGAKLLIEHCTIFGFATNGINASKTSAGALVVQDSTIEDNNIGIRVTSTNGVISTTVSNCRVQACTTGVDGLAGAVISVADSYVTHNSNFGIIAEISATVNVTNCSVSNNGTGIQANVGTTVRVSNNNVFNNTGKGIANLAGAGMATATNNRTGGNGIADDTPPTAIVIK